MFLLQHNTIHIRRHDKWETHFLLLTFFSLFSCLSFPACLFPSTLFCIQKFPLFLALRTHKRQWMENFVFKSHEKLFYPIFFHCCCWLLLLLLSIDYYMCSRCCILSSSLYTKLFLFEFLTVFNFLLLRGKYGKEFLMFSYYCCSMYYPLWKLYERLWKLGRVWDSAVFSALFDADDYFLVMLYGLGTGATWVNLS